jgi:hypothetical protein
MFAVRFLSGARQNTYLPCAFLRAHDKQLRTVSTTFAVHFTLDARQTSVFAVRSQTGARQSFFTNGRTNTPSVPFTDVNLFRALKEKKTHGKDAMFTVRLY